MANNEKDRSWFLGVLEKYRSGKATLAEKEYVEQYLDNMEKLSGTAIPAEKLEQSLAGTKDKLLDHIRKENGSGRPAAVISIRRFWWAAASVILIAGAFFWFEKGVRSPDLSQASPAKYPDLQPGGEKAILTLADGSTIVLDSAVNGELADQGAATVMKNSDGQLYYQTGSHESAEEIVYNTVQTPRGGQYHVRLPDGTLVWLNAASSIRFPTVFSGAERNVEMSGEAYFEVAKNAQQPFKVLVNGQVAVEVTGTHFNVNAYEDESTVKTTLLEGSVNVNNRKTGPVKLIPGQQAIAGKDKKPAEVSSNVDVEEIMAWKNGYFQFNRADIKTVMRQIGRWYDVEISYEGKVPGDLFVGKIPRQAPASQVLKVLEEMDVHFRIEGKKVIVTP